MGNALHKETAMATANCSDMGIALFYRHRACAIPGPVDVATNALRDGSFVNFIT